MEKLFATLVIFSFFLLKWNYGKLGDRYAIFLYFHFLNTMEKMVRINRFFFHFSGFLFLGKDGKIEKKLGIEDYFILRLFSNNIENLKNIYIAFSRLHCFLHF